MASAEAIKARLAGAPHATNFIMCWDIHGHDFFGQWEMHQQRVSRVCVRACLCASVCVCLSVCMYVCMYVCVYTRTPSCGECLLPRV
jgi:hypothetical protein